MTKLVVLTTLMLVITGGIIHKGLKSHTKAHELAEIELHKEMPDFTEADVEHTWSLKLMFLAMVGDCVLLYCLWQLVFN